MAEHVTEWLGAYHDAELHGVHLRQVEQHLAECAECRAELDGIQGLSALLLDAAPAGDFLPTEHFVANLTLGLPRQTENQPRPRRWLEIGWWLMPVGLLGTWLFIQITLSLSDVASFAADSGLFSGNLAWLQDHPPQMEWFVTAINLVGDQLGTPGRMALSALNDVHIVVTRATGQYVWQALFAVLYLGWLLSWWLRHQRQPSQNAGGVPNPGV